MLNILQEVETKSLAATRLAGKMHSVNMKKYSDGWRALFAWRLGLPYESLVHSTTLLSTRLLYGGRRCQVNSVLFWLVYFFTFTRSSRRIVSLKKSNSMEVKRVFSEAFFYSRVVTAIVRLPFWEHAFKEIIEECAT